MWHTSGLMARQRICFISAEISPFAKTGGLGDVTGALTRQLHRRGHDVRVFVPLHGLMEFQGAPLRHVESLQELTVVVGSQLFQYDVAAAPLPGAEGFEIFLIDCPALFDRPWFCCAVTLSRSFLSKQYRGHLPFCAALPFHRGGYAWCGITGRGACLRGRHAQAVDLPGAEFCASGLRP